MELVEATTEDLDAVRARWYALASTMEGYDDLNELRYDDADAVPEKGFRRLLDDDAVSIYLVTEDASTVGYVTLRSGSHPSREYAEYLRIVDLLVDESHRGQGYGSAVVDRVKELARERGCDHVKVSCEWENEGARRFYREAGFRPKQVDYVQPLE